jgi:hypothetical protein
MSASTVKPPVRTEVDGHYCVAQVPPVTGTSRDELILAGRVQCDGTLAKILIDLILMRATVHFLSGFPPVIFGAVSSVASLNPRGRPFPSRRRPLSTLTRMTVALKLAEAEGFEPPDPLGSPVFKTGAIGRSATPPWG